MKSDSLMATDYTLYLLSVWTTYIQYLIPQIQSNLY
jgi:hypothetical protein